MIKLFLLSLGLLCNQGFATEVLGISTNSILKFRGKTRPYQPLDKTYGDSNSLIEEELDIEEESEDETHLLSNIDEDELFEDTGIWAAYKANDYEKYFGRLLNQRDFKSYYLLHTIYRDGKGRIYKSPKKSIEYLKLTLDECSKDIERDLELLKMKYYISSNSNYKTKILQQGKALKNNPKKQAHRLREKELVRMLAERDLAYWENIEK
jgi:hypothetical protein